MIRSMRLTSIPAVARSLAPVAVVTALVVTLAACGQSGGTSAAAGPSVQTPAPSVSTPVSTPAGGIGSAAGQTDTDWGRIWDTLPTGFPSVAGATTAAEGATGPASANLAVPGTDAKSIATQMQASLTQAGYTTIGLSGPLENGGYVLDMRGSQTGCQVQVTATPTGSLTTVVVLYGAACPHE
jgi:hypothetical protein